RVLGNDAGEQLSILTGTLARLDREAPDYGAGNYNDFNTFYYQAASGTSGGSSGSPVIDIDGRVIALNAGGSSTAASSFYLPLHRVVRALQLIQQHKPVERGTLQTVFSYTPYDELNRLGLSAATEAEVRKQFPSQTGMLVVNTVQPGSDAENKLQPGDILLRVNGDLVTTFEPLDRIMDDSVNKMIKIDIVRGSQTQSMELKVQDLYEITPDRYLSFGDAIVHTLSWQMARHMNREVSGIYVANAGYVFIRAGIPRGAVITEVNGTVVKTLDDFIKAIRNMPDGEQATLRFVTIDDSRATHLAFMYMDRKWFMASECKRDDEQGIWSCTEWPRDGVSKPPEPVSTRFAVSSDPIVNRVSPSLVMVNYHIPYPISGSAEVSYYGTGIVVDAKRGLVVVDRNTVPVGIGDVRLTFASTVEVPGRVVYLHPNHNLAVVAYDPKYLGSTPVQEVKLNTAPVTPGEIVWAVGLTADDKVKIQSALVSQVEPAGFALSRSLRFRDSNIELIDLVNAPSTFDGVLVNKKGEVRATWSSFITEQGRDTQQVMRGIPADLVAETLSLARNETVLHSIEVELAPLSLANARHLGMTEDWVQQFVNHDPERRQALVVTRTVAGSSAAKSLFTGDMLLAIDGKVVNRFREVERAVQAPQVTLTILRAAKQMTVTVDTATLSGIDVDRVVGWSGTLIQAPYRALLQQHDSTTQGVFVSYFTYGSPSARYQLWAGRSIVAVDDQPTPDLDSFIKAVTHREDRSAVRLKTVNLNGAVDVITLKLDLRYWPTYELVRTAAGWERKALK
ncbi:MAG TPA: PDZ domain-containing protein, partial [Steroidobacteraceae bacterium]|nr:PDZ domain-containing protein [Steroidobacteraceae bacterium]